MGVVSKMNKASNGSSSSSSGSSTSSDKNRSRTQPTTIATGYHSPSKAAHHISGRPCLDDIYCDSMINQSAVRLIATEDAACIFE